MAAQRVGQGDGTLDLHGAAPQRASLVEGAPPLGGDGGLSSVVDGGLGRFGEVRRRHGVVVGHVAEELGVGHQPRCQGPADHGVPARALPGRQVGVHGLAGERVHEPEAPRPVRLLDDAGRHGRVEVVEHAAAQGCRQHAGVERAPHHRGDAERDAGGLAELEHAQSQHVGDAVGDLEPLGLQRPSTGRWPRAVGPSRARRTGCRRCGGSAPRPGPAPARVRPPRAARPPRRHRGAAPARGGRPGGPDPPGHGRGAGAAVGRPCAPSRRTAPAVRAAPRRRTPAGAGRSGRPSAGPRSARPAGPGWAASSRATAAKVRSVVAAAAPAPGARSAGSACPSSRSVTSVGTACPVAARSRSTGSQGQYGGARSASWQRPTTTWSPWSWARWTTSVASMDLPIPASPLISSTPPCPTWTRSESASWMADSALDRPTTPETRARVVSTAGACTVAFAGSEPGRVAGPSRAGSWASTRCSSSRTEVEGSTPSSSTRAARSSRSASRASACRSLR